MNDDDDDRKQCCIDAEPHSCGDCLGGTDADPYVNGSAMGWHRKSDDYYDGGRLIRRSV
jgi:hypothetical protein